MPIRRSTLVDALRRRRVHHRRAACRLEGAAGQQRLPTRLARSAEPPLSLLRRARLLLAARAAPRAPRDGADRDRPDVARRHVVVPGGVHRGDLRALRRREPQAAGCDDRRCGLRAARVDRDHQPVGRPALRSRAAVRDRDHRDRRLARNRPAPARSASTQRSRARRRTRGRARACARRGAGANRARASRRDRALGLGHDRPGRRGADVPERRLAASVRVDPRRRARRPAGTR